MWRHTWFKILVGLQLVNFAAMVLIEQQRRTIWNKEATNAQKLLDIKTFSEKTETDYRYVTRQLEDVRQRLAPLQQAAAKNTGVAAQLQDARERLTLLQQEAAKNDGVAALLKDTRDRVMNIEATLRKTQADK